MHHGQVPADGTDPSSRNAETCGRRRTSRDSHSGMGGASKIRTVQFGENRRRSFDATMRQAGPQTGHTFPRCHP